LTLVRPLRLNISPTVRDDVAHQLDAEPLRSTEIRRVEQEERQVEQNEEGEYINILNQIILDKLTSFEASSLSSAISSFTSFIVSPVNHRRGIGTKSKG
jgi:hypothetical protein